MRNQTCPRQTKTGLTQSNVAIARFSLLILAITACYSCIECAPKLPRDPSEWKYRLDLPPRLWDLRALEYANTHTNRGLLRRVVWKLNNGLPITVAVLGSSVTSDFAGCFHTSIQQLYSQVDKLDQVRLIVFPDFDTYKGDWYIESR